MGIDFYGIIRDSKVKETSEFLKRKLPYTPEVAIILGSGLSIIEEKIENKLLIDYADIPNFPKTTVSGHPGRVAVGILKGVPVMAFLGRSHYYEGRKLEEITFPMFVLSQLDVRKVIVTNAAGAVNQRLNVGDLVLLEGLINFAQIDIFSDGWERNLKTLFSTSCYPELQNLENIYPGKIHRGVYCWTTGPSYETPAEIRFIRHLGGDVVGMSTLPEVVVARRLGLAVIGISFVSNPAAGISHKPLSHEEVKEAAEKYKDDFCVVIERCVEVVSQSGKV